ncbi:tripartite tricarboxylate transporter TctB family protein [Neobacillus drentensis]|uniref:tripartite tricarboxylate transporter TctB family protein n=1 Tax=Neobacillus drentensis TaxID=220684 RepID=UPI001F3BE366|nr:tripartite tricarboxylate transporter TctB family protein [Neobacillus drentensis]ULT59039.1 tripartite tricarboxylate transporter TctB family protein [Neobacillus drentensis]
MEMKFDRFASILFLTVGVLFIIGSKHISSSSYGSVVGPDIFPFVLGIILVLLSIRLFYETFINKYGHSKNEELQYKPFIIIILATLVYILTLESVGYVITTFLFLVVCFQTMERRKLISSIIIAAAFSGIVYFLFVDVLKGTLPGWPIWF